MTSPKMNLAKKTTDEKKLGGTPHNPSNKKSNDLTPSNGVKSRNAA